MKIDLADVIQSEFFPEEMSHGDSVDRAGGDSVDRTDHIEKRGDKWVVLNDDRTKVLGEHPDKESAVKQLQAIEAHKDH